MMIRRLENQYPSLPINQLLLSRQTKLSKWGLRSSKVCFRSIFKRCQMLLATFTLQKQDLFLELFQTIFPGGEGRVASQKKSLSNQDSNSRKIKSKAIRLIAKPFCMKSNQHRKHTDQQNSASCVFVFIVVPVSLFRQFGNDCVQCPPTKKGKKIG